MFSHKKSVAVLLVILLLAFGGFAFATGQTSAQSEFSRRGMLENIGNNIILPLHEAFLSQTRVLQTAAHTFRDAPTAENLEQMQQAWRETAYLWKKVALFRLGRLTFVYHSRIENDSPIATQIIDDIINGSDPFDESSISVFGSNVIGLRTVEYLIFDPNGGNEQMLENFTQAASASRRMLYLMITVDDLYASADQIWQIWSPDNQNYLADFINADDASSVQESITMLANQMLIMLEANVNVSIGWPLGTVAGEIRPDLVDAIYSGYSIQQLRSFFEALRDTFNGATDSTNGLGFDDYLDSFGSMYSEKTLAEAVNLQIDNVFAALDAITEPLNVALINHPEQVQRLYEEGRKLVVLMKADMTSQLGITITFSDADGD